MIIIEPMLLVALAMVCTAISTVIWSIRRKP